MKERPILFSGPMVRAIREGRKTQTRRVVKPQPPDFVKAACWSGHDRLWNFTNGRTVGLRNAPAKCPYGMPGDRLWVKETWRPAWHPELFCSVQYAADSTYRKPEIHSEERGHRFAYLCEVSGDNAEPWHPSIHMWREFSRITLEIVGVRVEQLNAISEADARAEGVEETFDTAGGCHERTTAKENYAALWNDINGPGSWAANPWVWVLDFKRVEANS